MPGSLGIEIEVFFFRRHTFTLSIPVIVDQEKTARPIRLNSRRKVQLIMFPALPWNIRTAAYHPCEMNETVNDASVVAGDPMPS